jgi:hypothetical protein
VNNSPDIVTTGLDPVVHADSSHILRRRMDCRVKPGNDERVYRANSAGEKECASATDCDYQLEILSLFAQFAPVAPTINPTNAGRAP